jgi:hypothetical protein
MSRMPTKRKISMNAVRPSPWATHSRYTTPTGSTAISSTSKMMKIRAIV